MPIVVGVAFKPVGRVIFLEPGSLELAPTDAVIAECDAPGGGVVQEFGIVKTPARIVSDAESPMPLRRVLRRALPDDFARRERNEARCAEAFRVCKQKIAALGLPMRLIETEWAFDGSQITCHFTAEGRVDFRELVREVAHVFHTRVLMHQVGPRDHAKTLPSIGPCGRPTCCSTFLTEFAPVSIKMVKDHHLTTNPSKATGLCGKLMCCLRYETEDERGRTQLPLPNMVVMTPMGRAKVIEVNELQEMLTVQLETQAYAEVRARDVSTVEGCVDHAEGECKDCADDNTLSACSVPTRDKIASGPILPMA